MQTMEMNNSPVNTSLKTIGSVVVNATELLSNNIIYLYNVITPGYGSPVQHQQTASGYNLQTQHGNIPSNLDINSHLSGVITDIYNRLGKLSLLDVICDRLVNIERKIEGIEMEVNALKSKVDKHDDSLRSLDSSNCDLKEEQDKEELYRLNLEMKEEILDIKTRSMKDNLLFGGISRVLRTNEEGREFEDTESVIKDFIVKEMDIHEQISLERVHRLGKPRNGKPPFIVAKFSSHKQRELFESDILFLRSQADNRYFDNFMGFL
ncbi:hypothetical protein KUTeg_003280 [Tegillarca granosa]|uniref:Uncharacterized protein n=1 Tax=Tegillarca granosa TaxID=220873 RepID=A0ABQ9FLP9_TEGGR|nr:hypothetical protein KUTeg_003280 [Tegillarca granosa]